MLAFWSEDADAAEKQFKELTAEQQEHVMSLHDASEGEKSLVGSLFTNALPRPIQVILSVQASRLFCSLLPTSELKMTCAPYFAHYTSPLCDEERSTYDAWFRKLGPSSVEIVLEVKHMYAIDFRLMKQTNLEVNPNEKRAIRRNQLNFVTDSTERLRQDGTELLEKMVCSDEVNARFRGGIERVKRVFKQQFVEKDLACVEVSTLKRQMNTSVKELEELRGGSARQPSSTNSWSRKSFYYHNSKSSRKSD